MAQMLEMFDEPLITEDNDPVSKGDGDHLVREHEGTQMFAAVQEGEIVGFFATRDGETVQTMTLREDPGAQEANPRCFKCMCWPEGCACWGISC